VLLDPVLQQDPDVVETDVARCIAANRAFPGEEVLPRALGHDDDGMMPGQHPLLELAEEPPLPVEVEGHFGDEDEIRVPRGQGCRRGDVTGLASHELHEADPHGGPLRLHVGALDRPDGLGDGRVEPEALLDEDEVVVDGLGDADHADLQFPAGRLLRDQPGGLHRAVAADDEEEIDVHPFQGVHHLADVLASPGGGEDAAPEILDVLDHVGGQLHEFVAVSRDQALETVPHADDVPDPVAEVELHDQGAQHVVDPGAQSAAGDHGRLDLLGLEVDHLPGTGHFQGHR